MLKPPIAHVTNIADVQSCPYNGRVTTGAHIVPRPLVVSLLLLLLSRHAPPMLVKVALVALVWLHVVAFLTHASWCVLIG